MVLLGEPAKRLLDLIHRRRLRARGPGNSPSTRPSAALTARGAATPPPPSCGRLRHFPCQVSTSPAPADQRAAQQIAGLEPHPRCGPSPMVSGPVVTASCKLGSNGTPIWSIRSRRSPRAPSRACAPPSRRRHGSSWHRFGRDQTWAKRRDRVERSTRRCSKSPALGPQVGRFLLGALTELSYSAPAEDDGPSAQRAEIRGAPPPLLAARASAPRRPPAPAPAPPPDAGSGTPGSGGSTGCVVGVGLYPFLHRSSNASFWRIRLYPATGWEIFRTIAQRSCRHEMRHGLETTPTTAARRPTGTGRARPASGRGRGGAGWGRAGSAARGFFCRKRRWRASNLSSLS